MNNNNNNIIFNKTIQSVLDDLKEFDNLQDLMVEKDKKIKSLEALLRGEKATENYMLISKDEFNKIESRLNDLDNSLQDACYNIEDCESYLQTAQEGIQDAEHDSDSLRDKLADIERKFEEAEETEEAEEEPAKKAPAKKLVLEGK